MKRKRAKKTKEIEPTWDSSVSKDNVQGELMKVLNFYYNSSYTQKDAKKFFLTFIKNSDKYGEGYYNSFKSLSDNSFKLAVGWVARLVNNGNDLPESVLRHLHDQVVTLKKEFDLIEKKKLEKLKKKGVAKTVSEKFNDNLNKILGVVDEEVDKFIANKYKSDFSLYKLLSLKNVSPAYCKKISEYVDTTYIEEIKNSNSKKKENEEYKESYSHMTKSMKNKFLSFMKNLKEDSSKWFDISKKIKERKPRKKKVINKNKLVKNVKYEIENDEYKLKSINPVNIIGKKFLITFNTKYRILSLYYTSSSSSGFSIKGTTLKYFDKKKSKEKKIRKPKEILDFIQNTNSKIDIKKEFEKIKTKDKTPTGRINLHTIILKIN